MNIVKKLIYQKYVEENEKLKKENEKLKKENKKLKKDIEALVMLNDIDETRNIYLFWYTYFTSEKKINAIITKDYLRNHSDLDITNSN